MSATILLHEGKVVATPFCYGCNPFLIVEHRLVAESPLFLLFLFFDLGVQRSQPPWFILVLSPMSEASGRDPPEEAVHYCKNMKGLKDVSKVVAHLEEKRLRVHQRIQVKHVMVNHQVEEIRVVKWMSVDKKRSI
ncbi:uncharacterized protein G2W53_039437 [Senna tora]|uniref:Uncharacterized protein n=1 Tax=Senna tora TaxID=362788 RepID=A0A834W655_9FABA|nr:uncharacterized protein G2W53_039437 [Senna tora]